MKRLLVLLFIVVNAHAAQMPPQKPMMASLEGLPAELKQLILLHAGLNASVLNIPTLAQGITTLAATSKTLHAAINNPTNMLTILKSLPKAGALVLAQGLRNMPGIKNKEVDEWLKSFRLEKGQELFNQVNGRADLTTIKTLLENPNIEVNFIGDFGRTPLMLASGSGNVPVIKMLITKGADVNAKALSRDISENALIMATKSGKQDAVELLLDAGATVDAKNRLGWTPLMLASARQFEGIVKILLANGANVNEKNNYGTTSLMLASEKGDTNSVQRLLAAGALVNAQSDSGSTALMQAASYGNAQTIEILLKAGADALIQSKDKDTALKNAQQQLGWHPEQAAKYNPMIQLLENAEKVTLK